MLKKTILTMIACSAFFSAVCFAVTSVEVRKAKTLSLLETYPCKNFKTEYIQSSCELSRSAMLNERTLSQPETEWQEYFNERVESFKDWRDEDARLQNKIKPKIGMTMDYIYRHVMGPPDSINTTQTIDGMTSQWVYEESNRTLYLYFDRKNILSTIQVKK